MVLVIDCFKLVKGSGKSIGIYNLTLNLVQNLSAEKSRSKDRRLKRCKIVVFGNQYNQNDFDIPGIEFIQINHNPLSKLRCIWWELVEAPIRAKQRGADKILYPRGFSSAIHGVDEYIIIHDMIPFFYHENYPHYFKRSENFYIMKRLKASARSCKKVITISQSSKRDILRYTGIAENKIKVIYNGYNKTESLQERKEKGGYLLAITSRLPHKNAGGIINAYEVYAATAAKVLPLKIVGIEEVDIKVSDEKIRKMITCYKYIESDKELHEFIAGADICLFLSLAEGFGFPPIEAMQLGTPVVCSNCSSIPEIVGDAAILVNPNNAQEVAEALIRLQEDPDRQKELVNLGYKNIIRFSWERSVKEYASILMK